MCGRYTSTSSAAAVADHFLVDEVVAEDLGPRWNVAPTTQVYAVAEFGSARRLGTLRWGLVPYWADNPAVGSKMINARAETVAERPAYRRPFQRRRCLLAADGFYEWGPAGEGEGTGSGGKQAWYVRRRDGGLLAYAGLWDSWRRRDGSGGRLVSGLIITTEANEVLRPVHARMPVVLGPVDWQAWLDPDNHDTASLAALLVPAPAELFERIPVTNAVNSVRNDGPHLIAREVGTRVQSVPGQATPRPPVGSAPQENPPVTVRISPKE